MTPVFKVGDLVKRRGQEWYAIIIGFRTEIEFKSMGITEKLPTGHTGYPIFVWVSLDGKWEEDLGDIQSCSAALLEVADSPSVMPVDALLKIDRRVNQAQL